MQSIPSLGSSGALSFLGEEECQGKEEAVGVHRPCLAREAVEVGEPCRDHRVVEVVVVAFPVGEEVAVVRRTLQVVAVEGAEVAGEVGIGMEEEVEVGEEAEVEAEVEERHLVPSGWMWLSECWRALRPGDLGQSAQPCPSSAAVRPPRDDLHSLWRT